MHIADRFWRNVRKTATCWWWQGGSRDNLYGSFWDGEKQVLAHRFVLQLVGILLPADKMACHTCGNRMCVRPLHLYIGDAKTNTADSIVEGTHYWARQEECVNGHPFDDENTYRYKKGDGWARACRTCQKERSRKYRETKAVLL